MRHLRIGVALTTGSSALLLVYALAASGRPHRGVLAGLALAALVTSQVLLRADVAMYRAEQAGGDRVA